MRRAIWLAVGCTLISTGGLQTACRDRKAQPSSPAASTRFPAAPQARRSRAITQPGGGEDQPPIAIPVDRQRPAQRFERIAEDFDRLLDGLQLPADATVLDIGTGRGLYAMHVAERLDGKGRVFATDISPEAVKAVKEAASKRGLTNNLVPVLVGNTGPHGVDDFYRRHQYDLVLAIHVGRLLGDRTRYFKEIRPQLKGGGRLVIIQTLQAKSFLWPGAISNPAGLIETLAREPGKSPFIEGLRPETRTLIATASSRDLGAAAEVIAADFHAMSRDRDFGRAFLTAGGEYTPGPRLSDVERELAEFLMAAAKEKIYGELAWTDEIVAQVESAVQAATEGQTLPPPTARLWHALNDVYCLNTLLIFGHFREFLFDGEIFRPVASSYGRLRRDLHEAGYRLVDALPLRTEAAFVFSK